MTIVPNICKYANNAQYRITQCQYRSNRKFHCILCNCQYAGVTVFNGNGLCTAAELWLAWLKDEVKYAEETDRSKIITLFERAVKDYMCEAFFSLHCFSAIYTVCC